MNCTSCFQAANLPCCLLTLTIGTAIANTTYRLKFECSNGRIDYFDATTDGAGLIVLNLAYIAFLNLTYKIQLMNITFNAPQNMTVDGVITDCIEVLFEDANTETPIDNAVIKAKV